MFHCSAVADVRRSMIDTARLAAVSRGSATSSSVSAVASTSGCMTLYSGSDSSSLRARRFRAQANQNASESRIVRTVCLPFKGDFAHLQCSPPRCLHRHTSVKRVEETPHPLNGHNLKCRRVSVLIF